MIISPIMRSALRTFICLFITAGFSWSCSGQTDSTDEETVNLSSMLDQQERDVLPGHIYTTATFKATHLINGQSIENVGKGVMDFRISHRFGLLNQGAYDFFGLDNATTKLSFDYGITDWLMAGIGRSTYQKEYDGFIKVKILRQTEDNRMPLSLSYSGSLMYYAIKMDPLPGGETFHNTDRFSFSQQLLIARKFNDRLSLQLMPTYVHYNLVPNTSDRNDLLALGIGGRVKLSKRISLNAEYYYTLPGSELEGTHRSLAIGFDIETGGHVFQLHFTNSTGMTERTFIGQTTGNWADGDIHFGFNISRVFTIVKPKEFRKRS